MAGLDHVLLVRAEEQADITLFGQVDVDRGLVIVGEATLAGARGEGIAAAGEVNGGGSLALDGAGLEGVLAARLSELQRSKAVAVDGDIGIGAIGGEILADHESELAVGVDALADEIHVAAELEVALDLHPHDAGGVGVVPKVEAGG